MREWTIDTCVLYSAANTDLHAMTLLMNICIGNDRVVLDPGGRILGEYQRCLSSTNRCGSHEFIAKSLEKLVSKSLFKDGRVSSRHKSNLNRLKFHSKDLTFVGVASRSKSKHIVSIDGDFNEDVKYYLMDQMQVKVTDIINALTDIHIQRAVGK